MSPPMLLGVLLAMALSVQQPPGRSFDDDQAGRPPRGFTLAAEGNASPARWRIEREGSNNVLLHGGASADAGGFSVAVAESGPFEDAEVSVKIQARDGKGVAGLVWRYQDVQNHYVVQLDLGGQELSVYRVVRGNRIRVEREDDLELDRNAWHSLRVVQEGNSMRIYLGGIRVFRDRDNAFRGPGRVGLWASGDSLVAFDDFQTVARTERER